MSAAKLKKLSRLYEEWHWGVGPSKVIHVRDSLVPDIVGIGLLEEFELGNSERSAAAVPFEGETWIGYDPHHPAERIYVVLPAAVREANRNRMKHVPRSGLYPLQKIAEATGGDHADYPLPNLMARPLGIAQAVVYFTEKGGEEPPGPASYKHAFGHEHANGIKPILACDVTGRIWLCGGAYRCPLPGITG